MVNHSIGDKIFKRIGNNGKYQKMVLLMFCLFTGCGEFFIIYNAFMETKPIINYTDPNTNITYSEVPLSYDICSLNVPYEINWEKTKSSWIVDFAISCEKVKTSLLYTFLGIGGIFGVLSSSLVSKIGYKKYMIAISCIMLLSIGLLFIKNYYILLFVNFLMGFSCYPMFNLRTTILTEITDKKYRAYYLFAICVAAASWQIIMFTMFLLGIEWRFVYGGCGLILLCSLTLWKLFYIENPRFFLLRNNREKLINSMIKISSLNGLNETRISMNSFLSESQNLKKFGTETIGSSTNDSSDFFENSREESLIDSTTTINSEYKEENVFNHMTAWDTIRFCVIFVFYMMSSICILIEIKHYTNEIQSYYYYASCVIFIFLMLLVSYLMNLKFLGRRYTICGILVVLVTLRVFKYFFDGQIIYFAIRMMNSTLILPLHTLLNESYGTKDRSFKYGMIVGLGKISTLASPFVSEFVPKSIYELLLGSLAAGIIVLIVLQKETLNKELKD
jgi:hypothetical protein